MTLKDYTTIQAEIDALNAQKVQLKATAIKEITSQMDVMDISVADIEEIQGKKGFLTGPNGEIWSGKGRRPLWYIAQLEGAKEASTEPADACPTHDIAAPAPALSLVS